MYMYQTGISYLRTELHQLLEDIYTFRRDQEELKQREREKKKQKEDEEHQQGLAMRSAALRGLASKLINQPILLFYFVYCFM